MGRRIPGREYVAGLCPPAYRKTSADPSVEGGGHRPVPPTGWRTRAPKQDTGHRRRAENRPGQVRVWRPVSGPGGLAPVAHAGSRGRSASDGHAPRVRGRGSQHQCCGSFDTESALVSPPGPVLAHRCSAWAKHEPGPGPVEGLVWDKAAVQAGARLTLAKVALIFSPRVSAVNGLTT